MLLLAGVIIASAIVFQSCKKKEDDEPADTSFVANDNTFADYKSWTQVATIIGKDLNVGDSVHGGISSDVTRLVYLKDDRDTLKGKVYPKGTLAVIFTKKSSDNTVIEVTGMAKRGNGFNQGQGDWEWFFLTSNGKIKRDDNTNEQLRGANLMNGECGSCHIKANVDFIYSKY